MKNRILIVNVLLVFLISCGKDRDSGCDEFEFKVLGTDTNKWASELPYKKVDLDYFERTIKPIRELSFYGRDKFYFVCEISSRKLEGDVIVLANGPELEMYFIAEDEKPFLLACQTASGNNYRITKSKLVKNKLEMSTISVTFAENGIQRDSILSRFEIEDSNVFKRVGYDSARINTR